MRAIAYRHSLPITDPAALEDVDLPDPVAQGRDLLVRIEAIAVNPVDTKVRRNVDPGGAVKVLGYDAAGVVVATGPEVSLFKVGDRVFYAGALDRPGTNSQLHLVDERIVGPMPASLDFAAAAAMPLTFITAWELLFDRLGVTAEDKRSLLIIGGAGGVGSAAIQLARHLTGLTVVATASRPQSRQWCLDLGAHHVIDHGQDLVAQWRALSLGGADVILALTNTDQHQAALAEIIAPQGALGLIDDPKGFDIGLFKRKAISIHWEFMFTRSLFQTDDMIAQHTLLKRVAELVDQGVLRSTQAQSLGPIDAATLRRAHALIEDGHAMGKVVLAGF
ncbi:zinc-binding alcohol dehydrogenase family protein [Magnetospirillum gryphiswaldense]|uniref:Zinc-type alcohol dehydrogenase-like protein n=1 Tax=Magnetospirillum gryphiswaldense TaxID=55518 RepID=A4TY09_9PROT|nr:zinc-binding alcohol dehydrogenase family protein [Magnetospirillum gryphiswaldense]AVM76117.1 Zinc-type alcohol dehydrogenase-like protein [Magnetospirillum gryphiswaldense MSR-1]AVM80020.1 Zinc-type alcohol dehydrogenase-like protein [Magnetospirillum gryphiswaldense]CAM75516.1 NADPH:quinone reductase and related Zn-dependent oxidoreductases [Magnetospirillum gryphiswaldense MSR-1]